MFFFRMLTIVAALAASQSAAASAVGFHGMVLFGNQNHYASHLPMLHHPHNRQLVLKVDLNASSQTMAAYHQAQQGGQTLFTIAPEIMDLDLLAQLKIPAFNATLYAGHFEQGGTPLGKIMVKPTAIVISKMIHHQDSNHDDYLVFGADSEFFAVHKLGGAGDFDAILAVKAPEVSCFSRNCDEPNLGAKETGGSFEMSGPNIHAQAIFPDVNDMLIGTRHLTTVEEVIYFGTDDLQ